jgi:hypothetical protein
VSTLIFRQQIQQQQQSTAALLCIMQQLSASAADLLAPATLTILLPLIMFAAACRYAKSGNKDFATAVALWTLGDRGVLKVGGHEALGAVAKHCCAGSHARHWPL